MLDNKYQRTVITSFSNRDIKKLRSLHERKYRKQTGWFLAEGLRICTEALKQGFAPQIMIYEEGRHSEPLISDLVAVCEKTGGRAIKTILRPSSAPIQHFRRISRALNLKI